MAIGLPSVPRARVRGLRHARGPVMDNPYIDGEGTITVGRHGPFQCAAIAADSSSQLTGLVRRDNETLLELLKRLDTAIGKAWDEDKFTDELNG